MSNMWMVRAGKDANLIDDFKDMNIVAICWQLGDLSNKSDDDIKKLVEDNYKGKKKLSKSMNASQLIRFVNVFEIGDWIISYNIPNKKYLIGKITSDYYYSDKLAKKYNKENFCYNVRNVEWIGEVNRADLSLKAQKSLNSSMTIFSLNNVKNEIISKISHNYIDWPDFYMEFADKLLEFKNNRETLIKKIQNIYSNLNINLPKLEEDDENTVVPYDIDPFTVFALFNKDEGLSHKNRLNIVNQIKKEFSISSNAPTTFYGIPLVDNQKATFYKFNNNRGENDINNLWDVFELAIKYSKNEENNRRNLINSYNKVLDQKGVSKWYINIGLFWIRPYKFLNLDSKNRLLLSTDKIFSKKLHDKIKSFKNPPLGDEYLQICNDVHSKLLKTNKYADFPRLSHKAYTSNLEDTPEVTESDVGIGDDEVTHYWAYSPGENAEFWDKFRTEGIMAIGLNELGNLKDYRNRNEIRIKLQEINNDNLKHNYDVDAAWEFANKIKEGDIIFAKNGKHKIIGRGIVESEYNYDKNIKPYPNFRKVNWINTGDWPYEYGTDELPRKELTDITIYSTRLKNIKTIFDNVENLPPTKKHQVYTVEDFLKEAYIDEGDYYTLKDLLMKKKNIIIQGAPGVGKTFMAKRLAYSIMGVKDSDRVLMVQFHQSYAYEDFIMGYKPSKDGFEIKTGAFYDFCKIAEEDPENQYFFIIDEINRGNLSKIFGELFMLIENDKRGEKNRIQLLYSKDLFFIPENLYIIGLMNTADRSLAMIDYALRRRFKFFDLKPGFKSNGFKDYQKDLENSNFDNLIEIIVELNNEIKNDESLGEGFRIGHSYLCNIKTDEIDKELNYIIEFELIPLLKEYWFDEPEKIEKWSDRLRSVIN